MRFEPLDRNHDRAAFSCRKHPSLDDFLKTKALKQMKQRYSATKVLVDVSHPTVIVGYYSLSSTSVHLDLIPDNVQQKLPRHPAVPATLLARLAVDHRFQRQGNGSKLLVDALLQSYLGSKSIGSVAVIVDAIDDDAVRFYRKYGFIAFEDEASHLFLPMSNVRQLLEQAGIIA
jgi:GNAT superfamily N-acetyltransferase